MAEQINLKNLDKSNWKTYRFDQIAFNISERVDPNNTDLEVYVGLEHIDSESIHLKRHGSADDVNGQKLRFYPGDIIFGRRRAYQRKAALAEMDGFCSAHALVLRANPEVIDQELFPFFLHSDQFMHRAVDISVGSLSPTINWGTLKHEEFLLPPKEQQEEFLQLLIASDKYIQKLNSLKFQIDVITKSISATFLQKYRQKDSIKLGAVCTPKQWKTIASKELDDDGEYLVYGGNGVIGKYFQYNHDAPVIAISCRGENCGYVHLTKPKSYITGNSMCLDNLDETVFNQKFLFYVLYYLNLDGMVTGSAQPQIVKSDVERFKVNLLSLSKQEKFVQKLDSLWNQKENLKSQLDDSKYLLKSFINKVF